RSLSLPLAPSRSLSLPLAPSRSKDKPADSEPPTSPSSAPQRRAHQHGDPSHTLLTALAHGNVVVFDIETTGLSAPDDELIDLGAAKFSAGHHQDSSGLIRLPK
ncbi:MAG: hypothetical protein WEB53_02800, partial [Akkermansiaceae bacterium]